MTTCEACKFWKRDTNLGKCTNKKFKRGYGYSREEVKDDEVWVEDDEGWAFFTGPKFGCIHGKPVLTKTS